jgi:hypothetical protein
MSAECTDEQLRTVAFESSPLGDVAESETMFTLGAVSISRIDARFSVGFRRRRLGEPPYATRATA